MAVEFASPYARELRLTHRHEGSRRIVTMPFFDGTLGRPDFLHGGAIAGLLEYAAWTTVLDALEADPARIKPINITVDFMRGGQMVDTQASAVIVRLGRRIANVIATAWQDDEAKPIATANLKLMLERSA
jgi:uncharacterized protein (TIGR00369 family)